MNLKIFTLSTVLLFFIGNMNAQSPSTHTPITDISNMTLLVEDVAHRQVFSLHTNAVHHFTPGNDYGFRIFLDYQSETRNITYFRLRYTFAVLNRDGTIDDSEPLMGVTAPVIIPPVKRNIINDYRPIGLYPYFIHNTVPLFPRNYQVTINLYQYRNFQDYLEGNGNYTEGPSVQYILKAYNGGIRVDRRYDITTYPNPSTNQVTIAFSDVNATRNTIVTQNIPIQLTIFNKNGRKISSQTVISTNTKNNSALYSVDTTQLPKGMYFFEIIHGKNKTVKTIIKE